MRSWPLYLRWHRREDGIHIAAGFQPEDGAAVVQQVELDVATTPDQLLLAVGGGPGEGEVAPDQFGIDFQEGVADVPAGQEEAVIESAEECPGECIFIEL